MLLNQFFIRSEPSGWHIHLVERFAKAGFQLVVFFLEDRELFDQMGVFSFEAGCVWEGGEVDVDLVDDVFFEFSGFFFFV